MFPAGPHPRIISEDITPDDNARKNVRRYFRYYLPQYFSSQQAEQPHQSRPIGTCQVGSKHCTFQGERAREREREGTENSFGHCTTLTKPSAKGHMTKPQGTYMGLSEHWLVTQNFPYSNCHLESVTCTAHAPMPGIAFPPRMIAKWPSRCGAEALEASAPRRIGTGSFNWQKSFAAPSAPIH